MTTGSISLFNLLKTEDLQLKLHNLDENILKEKISDHAVMQESAQDVINEVFPEILQKENLHINWHVLLKNTI